MLEERWRFGDAAKLIVLQCDENLRILRLIVEIIYVVDHHEDGDLYSNCLIAYPIVRNTLECYNAETLRCMSSFQAHEDFSSFLFST